MAGLEVLALGLGAVRVEFCLGEYKQQALGLLLLAGGGEQIVETGNFLRGKVRTLVRGSQTE
jgi:hypothetical protein